MPYLVVKSLEEKKIDNSLLDNLGEISKVFLSFKNKSENQKDTLSKLKIYSISKICEEITIKTREELIESIKRNENPKSLKELDTCIFRIYNIGTTLEEHFDNGNFSCSNLDKIYEDTLELQEVAEELELIESIEEKRKKIPDEIWNSLINQVDCTI